MTKPLIFGLSLFMAASMAFCPALAADRTLYDDLGGQSGIDAIVSDLFVLVLADDRIAHTFDNSNVPRVEKLIAEQICELSDGPCTYSGMSMAKSHRGLDLNMMHFNALVDDLQRAMRQQNIPNRTQNRLLALLAPMKPDVTQPEKGYAREKAAQEAAKSLAHSDQNEAASPSP